LSLIDIILLSVALGIDCLVVSFCQGLVVTKNRRKNSFLLALTMGLFQGTMPILGYFFTSLFSKYITEYSSWIVFGIFIILGIKFIVEAFNSNEDCTVAHIDVKPLILMGIATSIDALASGAPLKLMENPLILSACIIGSISFFMSIVGFGSGNLFKNLPSRFLMISGGIILIGLAVKAIL